MKITEKAKAGAKWFGIALLAFVGWCAVMALYLAIYNDFEHNAVPVMVAPMDFSPEQWDNGYFHAKGSLENTNAENAGERVVLGTANIDCVKSTNTCTVATADVFDRFLNLDVTSYDIDTWDNRSITFHDDSSICAVSSWMIDRNGRFVNLAARKKSPIPDYALKSPLHPCDGKIDKNITLVGGFEAYEQRIRDFEGKNGLYFHTLLFVLNVAYFCFVWWIVFRRKRTPNKPIADISSADMAKK